MDQSVQEKEQRSRIMNWLKLINPAVAKHWLLLLAGIMWTGVGILLSTFAITWLVRGLSITSILLGILGFGISIIANRFQFSRLAVKNIHRILSLDEKTCVFSFQPWSGYLIIAVMMTTGILLRNSSIPKLYLLVIYAAIGGALLQASINYYRYFFCMKSERL